MTVFDLIRHGESCSNVYFFEEKGRFIGPVDKSGDNTKTTPFVAGDHFFRTVLTPYGVTQCVKERARLEATGYASKNVKAIFSSPLERAVETAILTTPFQVLKRCRFTIVLVPQMQEAVKYQCDLVSNCAVLEAHVDLVRKLQVKILAQQGFTADANELASKNIRIDYSNMDWTYESFVGDEEDSNTYMVCRLDVSCKVRPMDLVNELPGMLEVRAKSARRFFSRLATSDSDDDRYLIFAHGQIIEYFFKMYLFGPPKASRMEFRFTAPKLDDPVVEVTPMGFWNGKPKVGPTAAPAQGSMWKPKTVKWMVPGYSLDQGGRMDTRMRVFQGLETYRVQEKETWITKMGRVPIDPLAGQIKPESCPMDDYEKFPEARDFFLATSLPFVDAEVETLAAMVIKASRLPDNQARKAFIGPQAEGEKVLKYLANVIKKPTQG